MSIQFFFLLYTLHFFSSSIHLRIKYRHAPSSHSHIYAIFSYSMRNNIDFTRKMMLYVCYTYKNCLFLFYYFMKSVLYNFNPFIHVLLVQFYNNNQNVFKAIGFEWHKNVLIYFSVVHNTRYRNWRPRCDFVLEGKFEKWTN